MNDAPIMVKLGHLTYRLEATGRDGIPYNLIGPRGGRVILIRNVHSKRLIPMQGAKTLRYYLDDSAGADKMRVVETG